MPKAKSKAQQKAAGAALAAKRGEADKSDLQGASRDMYDSMSEDELDEMASTKREDLPDEKSDEG
jgi:TATA-binding protein-associated factor Taf7